MVGGQSGDWNGQGHRISVGTTMYAIASPAVGSKPSISLLPSLVAVYRHDKCGLTWAETTVAATATTKAVRIILSNIELIFQYRL
jgi:hypothetical protein